MLDTAARPNVFGIAKRTWGSLFAALAQMTLLLVITYALMVGLDVAIDRLQHLLKVPTILALRNIVKENLRMPWPGIFTAVGLDFAACLVRAVISAPLAVAMHRFVLLGETRRFFYLSPVTLRFSLWLIGLQVPVVILSWLILFAGAATGLVPILTVLLISLALFLMQTLQLLPAVALEEPSRDVSARLETALERSEGMFWRTLASLVLTMLPVILVRGMAVKALAKVADKVPLLVPLGKATLGFVTVVLIAAAVSWLFRYGANKSALPVNSPTAPAS
jgi:hypothetical protein